LIEVHEMLSTRIVHEMLSTRIDRYTKEKTTNQLRKIWGGKIREGKSIVRVGGFVRLVDWSTSVVSI
jgi:hypothetical protein